MTDRTVKVSLVAQVAGYVQGMEKAAKATRETGTEAEKLAQKKEEFQQIGTAALAMGAVAAAGVALAVKKFADWDAQMSQVQTLSHATAQEMDQLRDASLNMGQAIGFSATQVADAETELVKAGVSVSDMLNGALTGALNLAAAGQINVGQATEIAAVALTQFKLKGQDVPHVADLLAAGADKALGGVEQLGQALNQGGLVAAQFGLSVDDTVGTLSAFANAGLLGSDAGTSFKQMLLSLASPSQKAADTMKQYNIQAYDAQGNFVGITNLAGQLQKNLSGVSQAQRDSALSIIFGSDAIRTANVLYKEGSDGIQKWIDDVNDTGFASEQARGKMDNLNGDVQKLGAAFDTALIKTGSTANDSLRGLVQGITGLVSAFGELPQPAQGAVLVIGAVVAGVGLLGGGMLAAVPKIAAMKVALDTLGTSMRTVSLAGGLVAIAATALVTIFATLAQKQAELDASASSYADTLKDQNAAFSDATRAALAKKLADEGVYESAKKAGISQKELTDSILKGGDALKEVNDKAFAAFRDGSLPLDAYKKIDDAIKSEGAALEKSQKIKKDQIEANKGVEDSTNAAASTTSDAAQAYLDAADGAQKLTDQIGQLVDSINKANGVGQDAVSSNASYQAALAKVQDTIKKVKDGADGYSSSLDENTAAGSDNVQMFADLAKRSQDAADAQFNADHNTDAYLSRLQAGRQTLIDNIVALTGNADAAKAIADRVYQIPDQKAVQILADTAQAMSATDQLVAKLNNVQRTIDISVKLHGAENLATTGGLRVAFAGGGTVPQIGGPKSDSVHTMLSAGEEVIQNPYASIYRGVLKQINQGTFPRGAQRFADGGTVQPTYVPASSFPSTPTVNVPAPQFTVTVQSKGGVDLTQYIDVAIQRDKARDARRVRMG